jgi:hypothetical protein
MNESHYGRLALMTALSFLAMFVLMYAMVNVFSNVYVNVNQMFMAGLMAAPMAIIELALMRRMYPDPKKNLITAAASVVTLAGFWFLIRQQGAVGDVQFLRSMIPHHAGAILMCEEAQLRDPEVIELCASIVESQRAEIDQMKAALERVGR